MKKLFALFLTITMIITMTACSSSDNKDKKESSYKVAIVQQMDHASLDEIRVAIEKELKAKAESLGITIEYKVFNGQNDSTVLNQIGSQVVSDGYDVIIPIATLAAQSMLAASEDEIPIVFAAISDPVGAGLVESLDNPDSMVTGTSDYLDASQILNMMLAQNPDIKTVGLLYSKSEDSSELPIKEAKKFLDDKGIEYIEKTGTTTDEISLAVDSMIGKVDAVFTPTDNTVAAAEITIAEKFIEAKIPHYAGADSFVRNGAFATCGVNYTDLGTVTADMAVDILQGADVRTYPVHVMEGGIITVNTETAKGIGADYSMFQGMASKVVEVVTSVD
ncbi:MAG: ABC transporter substrate-binding protein [Clostridiaceae bacterium]